MNVVGSCKLPRHEFQSVGRLQSAPSVNRLWKTAWKGQIAENTYAPSPPFRPGATNFPDFEHTTTKSSIDAYASHNEIVGT